MPKKSIKLTRADKERARLQALFLSIGDGILATDEHGVISDVNDAALKLLGYRRTDLLGRWFPSTVVAYNDEGQKLELMDRPASLAVMYGKSVSSHTFYKTKGGKMLPVAVTVAPIMIDGHPQGVIEVFRDITHEHEVDKMKSEFISIASHQLRTPLTAIKTYSHMLSDNFSGHLNKKQSEFLDIILGSVERMNDLINTLLDLSRIEEGRLAIATRFVNLEEITDELIREMLPAAAAKKQRLSIEYQSDDLNAVTDPLLVKEVCSNLLSNAIKYTPVGGEITVVVSSDDRSFEFSVEDTGYGIPDREQVRVFSKFFRAENIMDKDTSGTGLGLYLVKKIAEGLGGKVSFVSDEDKGSRFVFHLPR